MLALSEEFKLIRLLGEGWAGQTWLARLKQPRFGLPADTELAIKQYKPTIFQQAPNIAERIEREATLGAKVKHPNLIRVYGLEKFMDEHSQEIWILVMQLCPNGDLSLFLEQSSPVSAGDILRIVRGVAAGLNTLHEAGVTHRDIKPQNILIDGDGSPKIGDFGVIRYIGETTITGSAEFLGTIRYSAPEVLQGEGATQASDIYSFGTVLYELLYGRCPYHTEKMFSVVVASVLAGPPKIPEELERFGIAMSVEHLVLESVCKRLLCTDSRKRPTAKIVQDWLNNLDHSEPFLEDLAEMIHPVICEHLYDWAKASGTEPTIFTTYAAWQLARALTLDDAITFARTKSPEIINQNRNYLSIVLAHIPSSNEYPKLPREQRLALVRALQYHQEGYVQEIYDERDVMASRDAAYMGFVLDILSREPDPEIHAMLQTMHYVTPWAGPNAQSLSSSYE